MWGDETLKCEPIEIPGGKAKRMRGGAGCPVQNQWLIETDCGVFFQSYNTLIAYRLKKRTGKYLRGQVLLDKNSWDYSRTTAKYRRFFLDEGVAETRAKIDSGVHKLVYLNTSSGAILE